MQTGPFYAQVETRNLEDKPEGEGEEFVENLINDFETSV